MYRRRLAYSRELLGLAATCSRCGAQMESSGELYFDEGPGIWSVAFDCPNDGETYPLWTAELQPIIARIIEGVDVAELPLVGSGQEPKELPCPSV